MIEKQLFEIALEIEDPVFISKVAFSADEGELHIHMDFQRGGRFPCAECSTANLPVHDTQEKTWRHLNFWQYKTYIHMRTPRVKCKCGVRLWTPPWTRPQSGFTLLFEAFVMTLAQEMPIVRIASLVDEYDTRIWRIFTHYVTVARAKESFADLKRVGIDETSARRGHNYISVFTDMDKAKVVFATPGKDADTVRLFAEMLPSHGGHAENITEVVADMSPAFTSGTKNYLSNATLTYSRFHIMMGMNKAVDEVRRAEQPNIPELKSSRYVWLKNRGNLTANQTKQLDMLMSKKNLKTARAYRMKLAFQDIYREATNSDTAAVLFKKWLGWAARSRLEPMKKFAETIKNHWNGILRYFETRLTTGMVEGINSRIQEIKRRARGFRNINNFINMTYLEAGKLDLNITLTHSK